jgi:hypothetical protein
MSLITCVSISDNCDVVAYGCYNGSVRLYHPTSGSVKTLGTHKGKVKDIDIATEIIPNTCLEVSVVVSGSR